MSEIRLNVQHWFDTLLDLVFPPHCVHCKRSGAFWCADCQQSITRGSIIREAPTSPLSERAAYAQFEGSVRSAIHALKYEHKRRLAEPLGAGLAETLADTGWQPTVCTAVPLHPQRLAERGYNQAALLAEQVARRSSIPFAPNLIQRTRFTRPQVGLGFHERQTNMIDAFKADDSVQGQTVLIIDDVFTTGATLRACALALREAGAKTVWALTAASAVSVDSDK